MTPISLLAACAVYTALGNNSCLGPGDCNGRNCDDCTCTNGACVCTGGWSGDHCETPACTDRASCSNHGNCSQSMHMVQCECDAGYEGNHCEQAKCNCQHGGTPDAACTQCTGCLGAWGGKFCDVWDDSVPLPDLIAKLEVISNASQAALNALPPQTMCKQGHECVGWGVDGATGMPTRFPVVALSYDPTRTDKIFHGKLEPLEVETTPNPNPTWAFSPIAAQDDTHAFATIGEFSGYVDATYAGAAPPMGTSSYSVYTMRKEEVLEQFFQQPGKDTALTVARAAKSFITMELPFDPATKTLHYSFDRLAQRAALSLPDAYETDAHKAQFQWFIKRYGTSYARTASMGALMEQRTSWQTTLRDQYKFDAAMLTKNANIDFAKSAQLDGPASAHDAPYPDKATNALMCAGGDSSIACDATPEGMAKWKASVDTAQHLVLLSFDLQPISTLLPGTVRPAFEQAVQAYLEEQRQAWKQANKCPASCNGRGFCRAPDSVQCTCACYFGNGCSGGLKDGCTETCSDGSSDPSCAAWLQFFDSTNGNAWGTCSTSRNAPSGCAGVEHSGGDITEIVLPNSGLEGTLPPSLGQLTAMERLALMGNNLYGDIPDLSGATSLKRLELNSNAFSGTVPASLGGMAGLQELWLSQNKFSGFNGVLTQSFGDCAIASSGQPCCDLSDNNFLCPLPAWLNNSKCVATCTL